MGRHREKCSVTLVRKYITVDVYVHPNMFNVVIYLDGSKPLAHRITANYHGVAIPTLDRRVETVVIMLHVLLKHNTYMLNDYYVAMECIDKKVVELTKELGEGKVVEWALRLNRAIEMGLVEAPYKLPISVWTILFLYKIIKDPLTKSTIIDIIPFILMNKANNSANI